jgi:hypothetical protein
VFRIIRRSPWIAVGALGAWLLDGQQGAQRRAQVTDQAKRLANSLTGTSQNSFTASPVDLPDRAPSLDEMTADSLQSATENVAQSGREAVGASARG